MPMNNRILRPLARPLLLDAVPGAAAAYSLRQVSNAYTGPVVTVRRSSDNAEADFKASEIDDGTLAAFCGAGDGLVKTWFDQSGNNLDASQATSANQPKIVDSGSLVTEGGKAALEFDGTDDVLTVAGSTASFNFLHDGTKSAMAIVASPGFVSNPNDIFSFFGNTGSASASVGVQIAYDDRDVVPANNAINVAIRRGTVGVSNAIHTENDAVLPVQSNLIFIIFDAGNATAAERVETAANGGVLLGNNALTNAPSASNATYDAQIGTMGNDVNLFAGKFLELLVYPSDQTANRERIEGDIAWYY
jgi:hypothetical protein